jgi:hypothetical protein
MMHRIAFFLALLTFAVSGQQLYTNMSSRSDASGDRIITFSGFRTIGAVVTGVPYSADEVSEHIQTLADGTHITTEGAPEHLARDSRGRWRRERALARAVSGRDSVRVVEIYDAVAGVGYLLDDQNKIAHRFTPQTARKRVAARPGNQAGEGSGSEIAGGGSEETAAANRPQQSTEKLGPQTIEGIAVEGTRRTTIWPIGSKGNDRPLTDVSEDWYSPQLKRSVLNTFTSLRSGDTTTRLTNITLEEPDPMLFKPPADYKIVEDTDTVTITLKRQ